MTQAPALLRLRRRRLLCYGEDAAADALPATRPYTVEQITADWWP